MWHSTFVALDHCVYRLSSVLSSHNWLHNPDFEVLNQDIDASGGDALLVVCLWKAGYAISDPGFSFYHPELRMFDPVSQEGRQLLYAFTEGLSGGCDASCQVHGSNLWLGACFCLSFLCIHVLNAGLCKPKMAHKQRH